MAINPPTGYLDEPLHTKNNPVLTNRYAPRQVFTGR
jgi:hypothetical protein